MKRKKDSLDKVVALTLVRYFTEWTKMYVGFVYLYVRPLSLFKIYIFVIEMQYPPYPYFKHVDASTTFCVKILSIQCLNKKEQFR